MKKGVKSLIKTAVPPRMLKLYRDRRVAHARAVNEHLSTKEVFTRIYRDKKWSVSSGSEFQSGSGSTEPIAEQYASFVADFINQRAVSSVVDLGCGDFNVGRRIAVAGVRYVGVDIVDDLISNNLRKFADRGIDFRCLNIVEDDLPAGELCLVRQVFQHLSNTEILAVLPKLARYKYVLITEHYPAFTSGIVPNLDKPHGEDTRLFDNSAVYLDKAPFALAGVSEVFSVDAPPIVARGEKLTTVLLDNTAA
ncbi:MAG: class I SAM-dependent methyltransferase [Rhodococcus sp. (in: high G+C Gram-positive bacteria)]|uniref:class I SAM-dependent methyltransferase n=1 Tax=Rhodococcus sp. TaxID=1831 RepID=UPI002ADA9608|nr:class I SAM-dependent methyltransferase [Rhodococcus sp. (in: high G+C Gram-positive bacteria)]